MAVRILAKFELQVFDGAAVPSTVWRVAVTKWRADLSVPLAPRAMR